MSLKPENVDFNEIWSRLRSTIDSVIVLSKVERKEWSERFSDVYKLCVAFPEPLCDRLYAETKAFLNEHVIVLNKAITAQDSATGEDNLLVDYHKQWLVYRDGVNYLNKLYWYLNQQHIKKQKFSDADLSYGCVEVSEQKLEIWELGLHIWRKNMIEPLRDNLIRLLLAAIENDRLGKSTNETVVQGVILSFVNVEEYKKKGSLDLYQEIFEKPFLEATGEYYRKEAEMLLQNSDCSEYMERVLSRLSAENVRSRKYLHPSSFPKVTSECETRMIAEHLQFLHSECKPMVLNNRRKDLQNMYKLLKPVEGGLPVLVKEVQDHITRIGLQAVCNLEGDGVPQAFVENILKVHKDNSNLIREVFSNDQLFIGALDKACATVINHRTVSKQPCKSPELLARYCDSLLKKSTKGMNESEIEERLSQSITVFKYIDDKDVFQKFYAKMLAKRLIHTQSVSMDLEESMINKLKQACGHEFTSKLHRMFTDIKVSEDLNNSFNAYCKDMKVELGGINFNIFVLQAGAWPLAQGAISSFAIPQPLEKCVTNFETFYNSKFNGRKLTFIHHLSMSEVKLCYCKRTYIVTMGTFHMAILLLFESVNSLTYKEIEENTKIADDQLIKHLNSLVESKLLLTSLAESAQVTPETNYSLNLNFVNKRSKFKITTVVQKEVQQQQEVEQTHASVDEDRKLYLQAAIVRIMKARKVIKHNSLMQQVIHQAKNRFTPSVTMIKKCIEALMEKQYLERTPNTTDEYSYVA
ncbi:cullin-2-like protein [Dinothrombium tinctorium]|uniref:Cullin-2 n=2 Tax=Dinothrombium tinctorium TaxID=1965070 RepID=A0A3S3NWC6_9ACAR|nr:cullin-2-like protein [Dinothrombium tinctorium]